jgi:RNA recognition motif-containing protein
MTEHDLRNCFGKLGPVKDVLIGRDFKGNAKSFAFLQYENPDHALLAVTQKTHFVGDRALIVSMALAIPDQPKQLKVLNIPSGISKDDIIEYYTQFGEVESVKLLIGMGEITDGKNNGKNNHNNQPDIKSGVIGKTNKNFAFVNFRNPSDSYYAIKYNSNHFPTDSPTSLTLSHLNNEPVDRSTRSEHLIKPNVRVDVTLALIRARGVEPTPLSSEFSEPRQKSHYNDTNPQHRGGNFNEYDPQYGPGKGSNTNPRGNRYQMPYNEPPDGHRYQNAHHDGSYGHPYPQYEYPPSNPHPHQHQHPHPHHPPPHHQYPPYPVQNASYPHGGAPLPGHYPIIGDSFAGYQPKPDEYYHEHRAYRDHQMVPGYPPPHGLYGRPPQSQPQQSHRPPGQYQNDPHYEHDYRGGQPPPPPPQQGYFQPPNNPHGHMTPHPSNPIPPTSPYHPQSFPPNIGTVPYQPKHDGGGAGRENGYEKGYNYAEHNGYPPPQGHNGPQIISRPQYPPQPGYYPDPAQFPPGRGPHHHRSAGYETSQPDFPVRVRDREYYPYDQQQQQQQPPTQQPPQKHW